jgi:hypothetical protein
MRNTISVSLLCLSVVACSAGLQTKPGLTSLPNVSFHGPIAWRPENWSQQISPNSPLPA